MSKENQRLTGVDQKPAFLDGLSIKARDIFSNLKGFKEVDSKDIHIEGIDPKSYGSFDRFMDGATKFFRKHGIEVAALFALTGCTTGGAVGVSVLTSEPHETSTLPSPDSTKTLQSPTEANYELTSTPESLATQELTLVSETEVATETVPGDFISINMDNIIYPPVGSVKENFEKGEYDAGVETIKQWVGVWEKMGVFEELEIENNTLSPVPLDGRARMVCVDTRKKGEYTGTMLCPPLDLINGGLKAVPEEGKWDETDMPLQIIFEEYEKLVTKGSGNELVYQFVDKYTDKATRYFDPATGLIVEGQSLVRDFEIVENEVVIEGTTGVSAEFLLDGNLKINEEAGRKYYLDFINSLAGNEQNRDYMVGLLGASPNGNKLLDYLKNNDYTLPSGLNLPYVKTAGYVNFGQNPIEESIKLDTLKIVVFGPNQWNSDFGGVKEYVTSLKLYKGLWVSSPSISVQYSGWAIDLKDNRLVMVAGAKDFSPENYPNVERMTIGGLNGSFNYERDSAVASGELIQINKLLRVYNKNSPAFVVVSTFGVSCGVQEQSSICDDDITQLFGEGKNLFDSRE